jgi:hypothetical protein
MAAEFLENRDDPVVAPNVAVDSQLLDEIAARLARAHGWRRSPPSRVVFDQVARHLPAILAGLRRLGFEGGGELPRRRPRRMYRSTWNALLAASEASGIPASNLLRACTRFEKGSPSD